MGVIHVATEAELQSVVEAWIADDPDAGDRAELRALLERAFAGQVSEGTSPDAGPRTGASGGPGGEPSASAPAPESAPASKSAEGALAELRDRFAGRLEFGTAGLRGVVAAGPNRMNRAVVRAATAAVAGWLLGSAGGGSAGGDAVGGDAAGVGGDS